MLMRFNIGDLNLLEVPSELSFFLLLFVVAAINIVSFFLAVSLRVDSGHELQRKLKNEDTSMRKPSNLELLSKT